MLRCGRDPRPDRPHGCSGRSANRLSALGSGPGFRSHRACDATTTRRPEPLVTQQGPLSPIVVSDPCPVWTTVSSGSANNFERIDASIVGRSLNERPVAPGPPWKRVSPENTQPSSSAYKHTAPGAWPGVIAAPPGLCLPPRGVGRRLGQRPIAHLGATSPTAPGHRDAT